MVESSWYPIHVPQEMKVILTFFRLSSSLKHDISDWWKFAPSLVENWIALSWMINTQNHILIKRLLSICFKYEHNGTITKRHTGNHRDNYTILHLPIWRVHWICPKQLGFCNILHNLVSNIPTVLRLPPKFDLDDGMGSKPSILDPNWP